jgi:hypothetical protein
MAPQRIGNRRKADENGRPSGEASPPNRVAIDYSCERLPG